jgi:peptidoglycan biosynthesis protein MviN/MurJ (putative lipid II flippase)
VRNVRSHLLDNLELYLMAISVAVAVALPLAIEIGTDVQELAATALAACVIQGLVLWILRRRNRRVRLQLIAELRAMLKDRINNHLTVVTMSVTQRRDSHISENERELLQMAIGAATAVSRVLEELSVESLRHRTNGRAGFADAVPSGEGRVRQTSKEKEPGQAQE